MATLLIFDFDGTLFASPAKPCGYPEQRKWYDDPASLHPPLVPARPGPEWWSPDLCGLARAAIGHDTVYPVLMTGRMDSVFRPRIAQLLAQVGFDFPETHLAPDPSVSTGPWKLAVIAELLRRYPFTDVVMYEDRPEHVVLFREDLERRHPHIRAEVVQVEPLLAPSTVDDFAPRRNRSRRRHPSRALPDCDQRLDLAVRVFIRMSGMRIRWRHCEEADAEHKDSRRQFMHSLHGGPDDRTVCVARAACRLPLENLLALLAHEAGHMIAQAEIGPEHSEAIADEAGAEILDRDIRYDAGAVQTIGPGVGRRWALRRYAGAMGVRRKPA